MAPLAAVMTGPGAGAIATVQLFGDSASTLLQQVFVPVGGRAPSLETGRVLLGHITDGDCTIDEVTIGCESAETFCIHCHGNPLIVEAIVRRLQGLGVQIVSAAQLLTAVWTAANPHGPIATEARLALTTVKTVAGAALVSHQVQEGLTATVRQWQAHLDDVSFESVRREARRILEESRTARLIIEGCTIALVGPPNTGKSTLLNALAGRTKAIVADVLGTTRDWVSADVLLPPLAVTLIDTAGLNPGAERAVDKAAQEKSVEMLHLADLVLLVLDGSRTADQIAPGTLESLAGKRVVAVLNKSDLPERFPVSTLPDPWRNVVRLSARQGEGLQDLTTAIHQACGVADFDSRATLAFTLRQFSLLERLSSAAAPEEARRCVTDLLEGPLM